ncbi:hypothetical protein [Paraburkholderia sp. J63]|uniref:hypothetical protein n=1 Tax=Paraburkholderia sp. J63 TaxID=2805434 RepID=UPI002ABE56FF|nr:hypothetical protein [Paraburkholderia sp. J63]
MARNLPYPAHQALSVIRGALTHELPMRALDEPDRSKVQLFEMDAPRAKQFAVVLGDVNAQTGHHKAQTTRILLERCVLPPIVGVEPDDKPYAGQRIVQQKDSKLAAPNQVSCRVADETALKALIRWYASQA